MSEYNVSELNQIKRGPKRASYDIATINKIVDDGFIAHIAYNFNGKAICIPMAYCRINNKIYVHGSLKNRMLLALLEVKEASLTIMHLDGLVLARSAFHHSVNYRSATIFGSTQKIDDNKQKDIILKAIVDQMIPDRYTSLRPMTSKERDATLVIEITMDTASAKIRAADVVDEKSDLDYPVWAGIVPVKQIALPPISDALLSKEITTPNHINNYYNDRKK